MKRIMVLMAVLVLGSGAMDLRAALRLTREAAHDH